MRLFFVVAVLLLSSLLHAQDISYPYPVKYFSLSIENKDLKMAYMDVASAKPNGQTIVLFHGKNFNGFYWKDVIPFLNNAGYRVIVPDQVGWGKSSNPNIHYSFHMLANNVRLLLDSLGVDKVNILAHSMGGMLASRFGLMFGNKVGWMILENPIGLEDYKAFVPYKTLNELYETERKATYESYKKYQQSYYPVWKDEYEVYVKSQAEPLNDPGFDSIALANAITYQMIYEQPVVYEFNKLTMPVLLIIGQADRTVVGKNLLTDTQKKKYGNYPLLGRKIKGLIKNSTLVELTGVGHIPHIQTPGLFKQHVLQFISQQH